MQRIPFTGVDFSGHETAWVIQRADIARAQFLCARGGRTLKAIGVSALVCVVALLLVIRAGSPRHQLLENTVAIERLATRLARAEAIAPTTVREVTQLLLRPDYDCRRLACEARLEKRNLDARNKLETILARGTLQADAAATR